MAWRRTPSYFLSLFVVFFLKQDEQQVARSSMSSTVEKNALGLKPGALHEPYRSLSQLLRFLVLLAALPCCQQQDREGCRCQRQQYCQIEHVAGLRQSTLSSSCARR